jgi:hypothetical protein
MSDRIDRDAELDRLASVLDRGAPVLEAWEVGLLLGSESSTRQGLGVYARGLNDIPDPVVKTSAPKWAPGAIKSFLAGEWSPPSLHDRLGNLRSITEAAS